MTSSTIAVTSPVKSALKHSGGVGASRPRSASADTRASPRGDGKRRGERVLFEDEVGGSIVQPQPPIQRALSQPVLNDVSGGSGGSDVIGAQVARPPSQLHMKRFLSDENLSTDKKSQVISRFEHISSKQSDSSKHDYENVAYAEPAKSLPRNGVQTSQAAESNVTSVNAGTNDVTRRRVNESSLPPKPSVVDVTRGRAKTKQTRSTNRRTTSTCDDHMSDTELANEVSMLTTILDGGDSAADKKSKSKLPWKKNKGRYTPSEELERVEQSVVTSLSRTSSWSSLYSASHNPPPSTTSTSQQLNDHTQDDDKQKLPEVMTTKTTTHTTTTVDTPTKPPRPSKDKKMKSIGDGGGDLAMTSSDYEEIEVRSAMAPVSLQVVGDEKSEQCGKISGRAVGCSCCSRIYKSSDCSHFIQC